MKESEPAEEMDAAEAALAAEPKPKDPLDALPKGYTAAYIAFGVVSVIIFFQIYVGTG